MRIIYYSYWGTYAAYLMAALHAGIYPTKELPSLVRAIRNMNAVFEIQEPVRFFHAGHQEGILPYFLQHILQFRKGSRSAEWFHAWFRRHYKACTRAVDEAKQSLKDGKIE